MIKYLTVILLLATQLTYAQAYDPQRVLNLDPKVMGLAACAGSLNANHVNNYANELYTIEQLKDAYHINSLGMELAIASKGQNHYLNYVGDYAALIEQGYEDTINELTNGTFDWDSQSALDYCQVKLFEYVAQPPRSAMCVGDFEKFRKLTRDFTNQSVDMLVQIIENY